MIEPSGKQLQSQVLETNARVLVSFLKAIPTPRHLCLEEGTHAGWLYEVLAPHAQEIVVAGVGAGMPGAGLVGSILPAMRRHRLARPADGAGSRRS